jgi:hypothetical protein
MNVMASSSLSIARPLTQPARGEQQDRGQPAGNGNHDAALLGSLIFRQSVAALLHSGHCEAPKAGSNLPPLTANRMEIASPRSQ